MKMMYKISAHIPLTRTQSHGHTDLSGKLTVESTFMPRKESQDLRVPPFFLDFHSYLPAVVILSVCCLSHPSPISHPWATAPVQVQVPFPSVVGAISSLHLYLQSASFSCQVHPVISCPFAETASEVPICPSRNCQDWQSSLPKV